MARMRSLKPEFWLDRKLARQLTRDERMLYLGLWNQADEWGRANGDVRVIKGQIFPFDDDLTDDVIETMLKGLAGAGVVEIYEVEGDPYLYLPKLAKHQRLEPQKVPSRHPAPPSLAADLPVRGSSERRADESARDPSGAQTSPRGIRAKHVAGSREHVHTSDAGSDTNEPTFDDFYAAYPRKEARRAAEKAWAAASKRASPSTIIDGLRRHRFAPEKRFIPLPATWLNADRWADGTAQPVAPGQAPLARTFTRRELDDLLGEDSWQVPPPPDDVDPEDHAGYRAWCQQQTEQHRAERVQKALDVLARQ